MANDNASRNGVVLAPIWGQLAFLAVACVVLVAAALADKD